MGLPGIRSALFLSTLPRFCCDHFLYRGELQWRIPFLHSRGNLAVSKPSPYRRGGQHPIFIWQLIAENSLFLFFVFFFFGFLLVDNLFKEAVQFLICELLDSFYDQGQNSPPKGGPEYATPLLTPESPPLFCLPDGTFNSSHNLKLLSWIRQPIVFLPFPFSEGLVYTSWLQTERTKGSQTYRFLYLTSFCGKDVDVQYCNKKKECELHA